MYIIKGRGVSISARRLQGRLSHFLTVSLRPRWKKSAQEKKPERTRRTKGTSKGRIHSLPTHLSPVQLRTASDVTKPSVHHLTGTFRSSGKALRKGSYRAPHPNLLDVQITQS